MLLDGDLDSSFRFRHRLSLGIELCLSGNGSGIRIVQNEARRIRFRLPSFFRLRHRFGVDAGTLLRSRMKSPLQVFVYF